MKANSVPRSSLRLVAGLRTAFLCTLMLCAGAAATTQQENHHSIMKTEENYTTSFTVEQTPQEVFDAIANVRGWWSGEIAGATDKPDAEFTYRVPGVHYSKQKITAFVPGKKIVWHVVDADLTFIKDRGEWKGSDIEFEISRKEQKTEVLFTHRGLVPTHECYDKCSDAWGALVNGNLQQLIVTGKAQPSPW